MGRYTFPVDRAYIKEEREALPECMCSGKEAGGGCGEDCLNRCMLIECDLKTCPAGAACTNRRFQKKSTPKGL